jgi:anti-sigma factor ChrR (cupin superfamily)
MSSPPVRHDQDHVEMICLHVVGALSPGDADVVATRLASCAECRQEMDALRPVVESFVDWPTEVVRPSPALWDRLAQRIGATPEPSPSPRWQEPQWKDVAPGISCKLLATDAERNRVSMLVRLAPDTEYPPHRHAGVEELHLLQGELTIGERKLYPGDYNRAEPGTEDYRVWSATGCACILVTSFKDVIL